MISSLAQLRRRGWENCSAAEDSSKSAARGGALARGRGGGLAPLPKRSVGVTAIITAHLFPRVWNMGGHQRDPVQGIQGAVDTLGSAVFDPTLLGIVLQSTGGETGTEDVGGQTLQGGTVVALDGPATMDAEAARVPSAQLLGKS